MSTESAGYLGADYLLAAGPGGLGRAVERMLWDLGFDEVSNIDGPGDQGADVIADRAGERWVWQCKWKKTGPVGDAAVGEALRARRAYSATHAAVVTNSTFTKRAHDLASESVQIGTPVKLFAGTELHRIALNPKFGSRRQPVELRAYQRTALENILRDLRHSHRALLVLATGLGKTVVAGEVVAAHLQRHPTAQVLAVAHTVALVEQLERALWRHLPLALPTHLIAAGHSPDNLSGLVCSTIQSALPYVREGYRPSLVVVDEAHHVGEQGQLATILELCQSADQLGVTATPWRGDEYDIEATFGRTSYRLGISDGMKRGFLADVDYRLFVDDLDWDAVRNASRYEYTLKDLNKRLFLPQRDERIRDELIGAWESLVSPRGIVFCQSIEHAERMSALLDRVPQFRGTTALHAGLKMRTRQQRLLAFRSGGVPLLTAVDVLNEGVDVPDVNLLCFARVTHSRRIFVQQLGRGLRLRSGKDHVRVLDFVSDIRRVAAVLEIEQGLAGEEEEVLLGGQHSIAFTDEAVESLMRAWIEDAASLETAADETRLQFPSV